MNSPAPLPLDLTIRAGLEFIYEAALPTPIVLLIKPRNDRTQHIEKEWLTFEPKIGPHEFFDSHGNIVHRFVLPPGRTSIRHDAFVAVPALPENHGALDELVS